MKLILSILAFVVLAGLVYYAIQTKPNKDTPKADLSDPTNDEIVNTEGNTATASTTVAVAGSEMKADESINKVENQQIDNANVKVNFKGFGPGKVHTGSFSKINSSLISVNGSLKGEVVIDMNSMTTDTEKLTGHLKTADFFDTAKYPTASFVLEKFDGKLASGSMTVHGVKKAISFPISLSDKNYTSTFTVDMKNFGINQTFANETVEVSLVVPVK